eukprot:1136257-Pelagomonas_calceolata.AAC.1
MHSRLYLAWRGSCAGTSVTLEGRAIHARAACVSSVQLCCVCCAQFACLWHQWLSQVVTPCSPPTGAFYVAAC